MQAVQAARRRRGPAPRPRSSQWKVAVGDTVKVNEHRRRDRDGQVARRAAVPFAGTVGRAARRRGRRRSTSARRSSPSTTARRRPAAGRRPASTPRRRPEPVESQARHAAGGRRGRAEVARRSRRQADARRYWRATARAPPRRAARKRRHRLGGVRGAGAAGWQTVLHGHARHGAAADRGGGPGGRAGAHVRARRPGRHGSLWPSRRCASSPRTSASTSPPSPRTGDGGIITRADVEAGGLRRGAAAAAGGRRAARTATAPGRARDAAYPIKGVRKMTAAGDGRPRRSPRRTSPSGSPSTSPRTMELRRAAQARPGVRGRQGHARCCSSPRRCCSRSGATPEINASWDEAGPGDRAQALRQPRHRRGHPARPGRAEHQGRRPAVAARAGRGARRR